MYIYTYIYMYIYIYTHTNVYVYVYVYMNMSYTYLLYIFIYVWMCICAFVYRLWLGTLSQFLASAILCLYKCVHAFCLRVYICTYLNWYTYSNTYIYMHVQIHMKDKDWITTLRQLCIHVYMYIHIYIYADIYFVCMYIDEGHGFDCGSPSAQSRSEARADDWGLAWDAQGPALYRCHDAETCLGGGPKRGAYPNIHIYVCMYTSLCVCVCVWERERGRMRVREKLHVYIDIFSNRYTSYEWTWTHSCILQKSQRFTFTFTYMYTYFFISTCMYAFIHIYTCVYVCIFIRIHTYRWVTAHVCLLCYSLSVWYTVCWQTCVEHHRLPTLDGDTGKCPSELWVFSVLPGVFLVPQSYYFLGLRAEKEITRARIVSYLELINGEKLKGQDRKRLLPRKSEADDDEEMVDAWNATRGKSKRTRLQEHAASLHIHAAAQLTTMRRWLTRATCQFLVTFHASAMSSSSSAAPLQHVFGRGVCSWTCIVIWSRFFPSASVFASAFTSFPPRNCRTKSLYVCVCVCVCMCVCACVCQCLCVSICVCGSQWTHTPLDWPWNERGKKRP